MVEHSYIFPDIAMVFAAALFCGFLGWRLKQPILLDYVLAGLLLILLLVGFVLFGKFVVWTGVVWLFRYRFRTAFRVGLGLTQIGEFSFILAQVSVKAGLISPTL